MSSRDFIYAQRQSNCEDISLIWFCHDDALSKVSNELEEKLRDINDYLRFFTDETSLTNYVSSVRHEVIVLIVYITYENRQTIDELVKKFRVQTQIHSVILFDINEYCLPGDDWKVTRIYHSEEQLIEGLKNDIRTLQQHLVNTVDEDNTPLKLIRELITESPAFLSLHLFKDIVINMSDGPVAKQVMLEYCRSYYAENRSQMKMIDRFDQTYKSDDAIVWYTKQTFVYRLINKALRTEDVEQLYMFRFYIADLCLHLRMLKRAQSQSHDEESSNITGMTVYRGTKQSLTCIETLRTNIGRVISINGFLSTSRDEQVARAFAGNGTQSIIFEIHVNLSLADVIAADISHLSDHPDEREVLFDIGSTFLVRTLGYDEQMSVWRCTLEATEDGARLVRDHVKFYANEMQGTSSDVRFAGLLIDMCLYAKAESYLQKLLTKTDRDDIAHIHFQFGRITHCESSQKRAMQHLYIALMSEKNPLNIAGIMMTIGLKLYGNKNVDLDDYREGIYWNERAFDMYVAYDQTNSFNAAYCLNNIGYALHKLGEYSKALNFHTRSLEIRRLVLPADHSFIAQSLRNIGLAHLELGDYSQAIAVHMDALDIVNRTVPETHWSRANTLYNLGIIYHRRVDMLNALKNLQSALNIYERTFKEGHPDIIRTQNLLQTISFNE